MDTFLLFDYENLQLKEDEIRSLIAPNTKIFLFHGKNQDNIPAYWTDIAVTLGQGHFERVQLERHGNNALDFFIAYHLGRLTDIFPNSHYIIISKDAGYDALLYFLQKEKHINIMRYSAMNVAETKAASETFDIIIDPILIREQFLIAYAQLFLLPDMQRPTTLIALRAHIQAINDLNNVMVNIIFERLRSRNIIQIVHQTEVYYNFNETETQYPLMTIMQKLLSEKNVVPQNRQEFKNWLVSHNYECHSNHINHLVHLIRILNLFDLECNEEVILEITDKVSTLLRKSKPAKKSTLENAIKSWVKELPPNVEVDHIISELQNKEVIYLDENAVTYRT